jgi:hypothetical protein
VAARLKSWLGRYLAARYGDSPAGVGRRSMPGRQAAQVFLRSLEVIQAGGSASLDVGDPSPDAGGLVVGDSVQWMHELAAELRAELVTGEVMAMATTGDLFIPGTSIKLAGTAKDPAVLVGAYDDDEEEDEAEGEVESEEPECFYLVPSSRLTKVVEDDESNDEGDAAE